MQPCAVSAVVQHAPERAAADHRHVLAGQRAGGLDAVQRAGQRLAHRGDLGVEPRRQPVQVDPRDARGHEQLLGVGTVEKREEVGAERFDAPPAGAALPAGSGVGAGHALADVEWRAAPGAHDRAGVLVAERRGRRAEQDGVAAPVGLGVGAAGERGLHADHDVARAGPRRRPLLDADVAGGVEDRRPHGRNTTFNAWPAR